MTTEPDATQATNHRFTILPDGYGWGGRVNDRHL
jgi:hypothetical protein